MHVAILGGGLQGCSIAIVLADLGARVTIFDRNSELLKGAAVANEGKIHLGYMYAGDPTLRTARIMARGALTFAPFLARYLDLPYADLSTSTPAVYVVHRKSQKQPDEVGRYLASVHSIVADAASEFGDTYFGMDLRKPIRQWTASEIENELNSAEVSAAFASPEVAIDPAALGRLVRDRIKHTSLIDFRAEHEVLAVEGGDPLVVVSRNAGLISRERFDHVVNALWEGRIALDSARGLAPKRPWIHRLKYGVIIRHTPNSSVHRSITVVLGPFGEVVCNSGGSIYLTWYPHCLRAVSHDVAPPRWCTEPKEPARSEIIRGTFNALAEILPVLRTCEIDQTADVSVRGGTIVAWGKTDIRDPLSELHHRYDIGVTSAGRYHTIDPGKLTMAPLFAVECAKRIANR
jgi:glycine/D-amino acid oxidase-like deaminating enzyme